MKHWLLTVALVCLGASARAQLAGRVDTTTLPSIGLWQSVTSADQAVGVSKRLLHLDYAAQPLVNVSLFAGATKPMLSEPATPMRWLAGDVIAVPGSTLDWALGTKMGDQWVPNLKTGVLFAHDLSRIAKTHLFGDFIGVGAAWAFGSN